MKLSRVERKLTIAMSLVGLAPLVGALVLGRPVVGDAYRTGVNPTVREHLDDAVALYQTHLETLRDDAERTADAIAFHRDLHDPAIDDDEVRAARLESLLDRYPHVTSIRLTEDGRQFGHAQRTERIDPETRRPITLRRAVGRFEVEVVVTAPVRIFEGLQEAGEHAEVFGRLQESSEFVRATYLWVYIALLGLVILFALGIGGVLARRITRRVIALAAAARQVGRGDLSVKVPTSGTDEIVELTDAFNTMVADLRDTRARVEYLQRIGAWQQFARRLAHEIKNPLTPIQLAAQEMVRSYAGEDPRYQEKLEEACAIIEEEVATLRRLVGEFSSFAKLPEADLTPADLGDFLQEAQRSLPLIVDDVFEDAPAPKLHVKVEEVAMPVRLDAMMLRRCLDNLVRNALQSLRDASQESGGDVTRSRVRIRATREGEFAVLRVEDDGPGVPEEQIDRLFDPYYTTKHDGTGLGLAIVKKVVLEHGGEIAYEESLWGGACLALRLPLVG